MPWCDVCKRVDRANPYFGPTFRLALNPPDRVEMFRPISDCVVHGRVLLFCGTPIDCHSTSVVATPGELITDTTAAPPRAWQVSIWMQGHTALVAGFCAHAGSASCMCRPARFASDGEGGVHIPPQELAPLGGRQGTSHAHGARHVMGSDCC